MIRVVYRSIDRFRQARKFKTLAGAQKYAQGRIGEHPEIGSDYAISGDGIGKITVEGASLAELFPQPPAPAPSNAQRCQCEASNIYGGDCAHTLEGEEEYEARRQKEWEAEQLESWREGEPGAVAPRWLPGEDEPTEAEVLARNPY